MECVRGLDTIIDTMAAKVYIAPTAGVELICHWSGSGDVYGNYGYMGCT